MNVAVFPLVERAKFVSARPSPPPANIGIFLNVMVSSTAYKVGTVVEITYIYSVSPANVVTLISLMLSALARAAQTDNPVRRTKSMLRVLAHLALVRLANWEIAPRVIGKDILISLAAVEPSLPLVVAVRRYIRARRT